MYTAVIDSEHFDGSFSYGELFLHGDSKREIFLSTNVCHPSMANNELSGPVLTTWLARWLAQRKRKYSYRIIFVPETISSIVYLSRNLAQMKKNIVAGFTIGCVGDERTFSFLPSRNSRTLADKVARAILQLRQPGYDLYRCLDRGGDERQYCSPGVDLPVASIMRSKYNTYPEYHTSLDNLDFVTPAPPQSTVIDVLPYILLWGAGFVLVVAPLTATLMSWHPVDNAATGSAINNAISRIGQPLLSALIFVAISGTFYTALERHFPGVDAADPSLRAMVQPLNPPAAGVPDAVAGAAKDASVDAFHLAVLVCGSLLALGAVANGVGLRSKSAEQAARAGAAADA